MGLKKVYIVTEISASPDGSPFVFITLRDPSEVRGPQKVSTASPMVTFTSMNDMFKNLGRVISKQMMGGFATVIKLSLNEYEKLDFKVGDRVSVAIDKTQISIP
jgi:hypothetical protein